MMREHLYRGIPKSDSDRYFFADIWKDNCEGSFVYGSLIISNDRYYICVSALCQINCCINNGMTSMIEVIPETVGQYTGLTDKNGKKIFEGDIIIESDGGMDGIPREVLWDEVWMQFESRLVRKHWAYGRNSGRLWLMRDRDIEIIGNIHDNPELLKDQL